MLNKKLTSVLLGLGVLALGATVALATAPRNADTLPPEKQAMENKLKEHESLGTKAPKPSDAQLKSMQKLPEPVEAWPSGLFQQGDFSVPFHAEDVLIENMWQQDIGSRHVQVYAGKVSNDPDQGVVIVRATSMNDLNDVTTQRFPTKLKNGSLKILGENAHKLSIQTAKGKPMKFDVDALTFAE